MKNVIANIPVLRKIKTLKDLELTEQDEEMNRWSSKEALKPPV
jgi:hypothetical protein